MEENQQPETATKYYKLNPKLDGEYYGHYHQDSILRHPDFVLPIIAQNVQTKISDSAYSYIEVYDIALNTKDLIEVTAQTTTGFTVAIDDTEYKLISWDWQTSECTVSNLSSDDESFTVAIANLKVPNSLLIDKNGNRWSEVSIININFSELCLKEQIRARYGFFDRPASGNTNVILDSFFPRLLYKYNMDLTKITQNESFPKTSVAISPFIANVLGVKQMETEQLCLTLGYKKKQIKDLLRKVKNRNLHFVFAGVGGTGVNTAYWLNTMAEMCNVTNLFRVVSTYESDTIEISNLLRFPIDIRTCTGKLKSSNYIEPTQKTKLLAGLLDRLSSRKPIHKQHYLPHICTTYEGEEYIDYPYEIYDNTYDLETHGFKDTKAKDNTIIYGAPEIASRNLLSQAGNFICATHASTSCSIWINPHQDEEMQVESYGMIQLGGFFMNQLKMAITLLEILADESIDLHEKDQHIMTFEFDGTIQQKTDVVYHWQLDRNLHMMTENEANNL